jgi:hypothetical protein
LRLFWSSKSGVAMQVPRIRMFIHNHSHLAN